MATERNRSHLPSRGQDYYIHKLFYHLFDMNKWFSNRRLALAKLHCEIACDMDKLVLVTPDSRNVVVNGISLKYKKVVEITNSVIDAYSLFRNKVLDKVMISLVTRSCHAVARLKIVNLTYLSARSCIILSDECYLMDQLALHSKIDENAACIAKIAEYSSWFQINRTLPLQSDLDCTRSLSPVRVAHVEYASLCAISTLSFVGPCCALIRDTMKLCMHHRVVFCNILYQECCNIDVINAVLSHRFGYSAYFHVQNILNSMSLECTCSFLGDRVSDDRSTERVAYNPATMTLGHNSSDDIANVVGISMQNFSNKNVINDHGNRQSFSLESITYYNVPADTRISDALLSNGNVVRGGVV